MSIILNLNKKIIWTENTFIKSLKDPENATDKIYRKLLSKTHKLSFLTLAEYLIRLRMRGGVNLNFIPWTRIRLRLGKVFIQQVTTRISPLSNTLWLPPVPKILSSVFTVSKYILRTRLLKCSCITHLHNVLHFKKFNEIMFNFVNDKVWWLKVKSFVVLEWSFNGVPGGIF